MTIRASTINELHGRLGGGHSMRQAGAHPLRNISFCNPQNSHVANPLDIASYSQQLKMSYRQQSKVASGQSTRASDSTCWRLNPARSGDFPRTFLQHRSMQAAHFCTQIQPIAARYSVAVEGNTESRRIFRSTRSWASLQPSKSRMHAGPRTAAEPQRYRWGLGNCQQSEESGPFIISRSK